MIDLEKICFHDQDPEMDKFDITELKIALNQAKVLMVYHWMFGNLESKKGIHPDDAEEWLNKWFNKWKAWEEE